MDNTTNRQPAIGQGNRQARPFQRLRPRTEAEQIENNDIIALCPADGWKAYSIDGEGTLFAEPLIGWVIYDDADTIGREVHPMVWQNQEEAYMETNFGDCYLGCLAPGEKIPWHWKKKARIEKRKFLVKKKKYRSWMAWLASWF